MTDLEMAAGLRKAAGFLRDCGWHQGDAFGPNGSRCAARAIYDASGENAHTFAPVLGLRQPTWDEVFGAAGDWTTLPDTIPGWNDTPGRTLDEVLERLESAALALEIRALAHEPLPALPAHEPELVTA